MQGFFNGDSEERAMSSRPNGVALSEDDGSVAADVRSPARSGWACEPAAVDGGFAGEEISRQIWATRGKPYAASSRRRQTGYKA